MRRELSLGTAESMIVEMSEGNPGALDVLVQLFEGPEDFIVILGLDDMNIRGSQIWVAFKDFADRDAHVLRWSIIDRSPQLVEIVNRESRRGNYATLAVTHGASYPGGRRDIGQEVRGASMQNL